jgi:hypothetical protein
MARRVFLSTASYRSRNKDRDDSGWTAELSYSLEDNVGRFEVFGRMALTIAPKGPARKVCSRFGGVLFDGLGPIAQPRLVSFDPAGAALAFGDDLVLALEDGGRLLEGLLADQLALVALVAQGQIPVLGDFLGELKAFLLGAGPPVAAGELGRAPPVAAIRPYIDMDLAAENRARGHGGGLRRKWVKCVRGIWKESRGQALA